MTSRLRQLSALGQSVWIDYLSRDLIESGALAKAVGEDAVVGVTSNPTIFEKALASRMLMCAFLEGCVMWTYARTPPVRVK